MFRSSPPRDTSNWREADRYFRDPEDCSRLVPGCLSFSPGWQHQGNRVCYIFWRIYHLLIQYQGEEPFVSKTLRDPNSPGRQWLREMRRSHMVVTALLAVMHPELYESGIDALSRLYQIPTSHTVAELWGNPFTALSIISNRSSPLHRDTQSTKAWYDLLLTLGGDDDLAIRFPSLRLSFRYCDGTSLAFSGNYLPHEVAECATERLCLAYFFRQFVLKALDVDLPAWSIHHDVA